MNSCLVFPVVHDLAIRTNLPVGSAEAPGPEMGWPPAGLSALLAPEHHPLSVARLLDEKALRAHYQPIARLDTAEVVAHESLIRLPAGHALRDPDELFRAARQQGLLVRTEQAAWMKASAPGAARTSACCS